MGCGRCAGSRNVRHERMPKEGYIYIWKYKETMDFSFDFMALKISKQVSDRFLVSMAMILIFELSKEV